MRAQNREQAEQGSAFECSSQRRAEQAACWEAELQGCSTTGPVLSLGRLITVPLAAAVPRPLLPCPRVAHRRRQRRPKQLAVAVPLRWRPSQLLPGCICCCPLLLGRGPGLLGSCRCCCSGGRGVLLAPPALLGTPLLLLLLPVAAGRPVPLLALVLVLQSGSRAERRQKGWLRLCRKLGSLLLCWHAAGESSIQMTAMRSLPSLQDPGSHCLHAPVLP